MSISCRKTKTKEVTTTNQSKEEKPHAANEVKRGKTRVTKSRWLVLAFNVIGWKSGASLPDQSHFEVEKTQRNFQFTKFIFCQSYIIQNSVNDLELINNVYW